MNQDQDEINKFNDLADQWWDTTGHFKTLHDINPARIAFIESLGDLNGKKVLDVGCGGGILAESLAIKGAKVTGIDLAADSIETAKAHAETQQLDIDYQCISAETMAETHEAQYDAVICMELLEHVPNPAALVKTCAQLTGPNGLIFFSTINRNPKAYFLTVLLAEYVMRLLPRGTHDYQKFIKPSELDQFCREAELNTIRMKGITYHPLNKQFKLSEDVSANYLLAARKPTENSE